MKKDLSIQGAGPVLVTAVDFFHEWLEFVLESLSLNGLTCLPNAANDVSNDDMFCIGMQRSVMQERGCASDLSHRLLIWVSHVWRREEKTRRNTVVDAVPQRFKQFDVAIGVALIAGIGPNADQVSVRLGSARVKGVVRVVDVITFWWAKQCQLRDKLAPIGSIGSLVVAINTLSARFTKIAINAIFHKCGHSLHP